MTTRQADVVLVCGSDPWSNAMFHGLVVSFPELVAIQEAPLSRSSLIRGRIKRLGWLSVLDQIAFLAYAAAIGRPAARKRIENAWRESKLNTAPIPDDRCIRVASINGPGVPDLLRSLSPKIVAVHGTGIIKRALLDAAAFPFINYHAGLTPRYRGVHGAYWARAEGRNSDCGVTIHLVDEGVDTGNIVAQARLTPSRNDNFFTLPIRQLALGLPLMAQALHDALDGRLKSRKPEGESRQYYHPGLTGYVWRGLTHGAW